MREAKPGVEWMALRKLARTEVPYVMQAGRYLFFGLCAFGFALSVGALCKFVEAPEIVVSYAGSAAFLAGFLALRDMSKPWDLARKAAAKALKDTTDEA